MIWERFGISFEKIYILSMRKIAEKNNEKDYIEKLISNAKANTQGFYHSFRVYWYPVSEKIQYKFYIDKKMRILYDSFGFDRKQIPKGFIHLIGGVKMIYETLEEYNNELNEMEKSLAEMEE